MLLHLWILAPAPAPRPHQGKQKHARAASRAREQPFSPLKIPCPTTFLETLLLAPTLPIDCVGQPAPEPGQPAAVGPAHPRPHHPAHQVAAPLAAARQPGAVGGQRVAAGGGVPGLT